MNKLTSMMKSKPYVTGLIFIIFYLIEQMLENHQLSKQFQFKRIIRGNNNGDCQKSFDVVVCFCGKEGCLNIPLVSSVQNERNFFCQISFQQNLLWLAKDQSVSQQKSLLFIPKKGAFTPSGQHFVGFCQVCKIIYFDYLKHIQGESHRINVESTEFNNYIKQICLFVQQKMKPKRRKFQKRRGNKFSKSNGYNKRFPFIKRQKGSGKFISS